METRSSSWRRSSAAPARRRGGGGAPRRACRATAERFPRDYGDVVQQAQGAVRAALKDGATLVEVEVPAGGLATVPGDVEGGVEMSLSAELLRDVARNLGVPAERTRVLFPDKREEALARAKGAFKGAPFRTGHLTAPNALLEVFINTDEPPSKRVAEDDALYLAAYPSFNVNEMLAVRELYESAARDRGQPIVVFNGELDRIRTGYYPGLFYPKIADLARDVMPLFETAYYVHNFKGSTPGALFRAYPGPWQVLRRDPSDPSGQPRVVAELDERPTLREVSMEILPRS